MLKFLPSFNNNNSEKEEGDSDKPGRKQPGGVRAVLRRRK